MLGATRTFRWWSGVTLLALVATLSVALPSTEPSVEDLKARLDSAAVKDKPHLFVQIAQKQLQATLKLYAAGDVETGRGVLVDVVTYTELARDYSLRSHKYQKQSEIAVRAMTRKLTDLMHSLSKMDQAP